MGSITVDEAITAHNRSIDNLDPSKTCETCKHQNNTGEDSPCVKCFDSFLWLHVNPSNWEDSDEPA